LWSTRYESAGWVLLIQLTAYSAGVRSSRAEWACRCCTRFARLRQRLGPRGLRRNAIELEPTLLGPHPCGTRRLPENALSMGGQVSGSKFATLLLFQPTTTSLAQLAAVSYLARYSGHTHALFRDQETRPARRPLPHRAQQSGKERPLLATFNGTVDISRVSPFQAPPEVSEGVHWLPSGIGRW